MSINYSLDKMRKLVSILPPFTRPTVHVAGTNGKGSTTVLLDYILRSARFRTGRFNSPHFVDPWDCICINCLPVSRDVYLSTRSRIESMDRAQHVDASPFEILTATALMIFEDAKVDIAILECGMGGKLDATNAISNDVVVVSAITSVDLDHQLFLGDTVEAIAAHKAHIARKGRVLVLGPQKHSGVEDVVAGVVKALDARLVKAIQAEERQWDEGIDGPHSVAGPFRPGAGNVPPATPFLFPSAPPLRGLLNLPGKHQIDNLSTALTILEHLRAKEVFSCISSAEITDGVRSARWPGRLSWTDIDTPKGRMPILADAAHNYAGAAALASYLDSIIPTARTFLIALSHSPPKTPLETLTPVLRHGDRVAVLPFSPVEGMPWVKPTPYEDIRGAVAQLIGTEGEVVEAFSIPEAITWAVQKESLLIIAGSIYLLSDFERYVRSSQRA